jgi:hypothetical protein
VQLKLRHALVCLLLNSHELFSQKVKVRFDKGTDFLDELCKVQELYLGGTIDADLAGSGSNGDAGHSNRVAPYVTEGTLIIAFVDRINRCS